MTKDWAGNSTAAIITTGGRNFTETEREQNDYYATNPRAIDLLFMRENFSKKIWEPACGEGHLSKRMEQWGKEVVSTDLIERGFGIGGVNFLESNTPWVGDIITNPPFKFAEDFIVKALSLTNGKIAMFLRIQFLEGIGRYDRLFTKFPPARLYVFSSRIGCGMNGDFKSHSQSAVCYAWWVWDKEHIGPPTIQWIKDEGVKEMDI